MSTTHLMAEPNHHAGQGSFSGVAGLIVAATMAVGRRHDADWALELTQPARGAAVVDVGCGPGQAARIAARRGLRVTGVDPSPQMLRMAGWLDRRAGARYLKGAAEAIPIGDGAAAACWSVASVHHWTDVGAGVAEVYRTLTPGGRFAAIERRTTEGATGHAGHGWSDAQATAFADLCRAAGFESVTIEHRTVRRRRDLVAVVATKPVDAPVD